MNKLIADQDVATAARLKGVGSNGIANFIMSIFKTDSMKINLLLIISIFTIGLKAQTSIKGTVKDAKTGETLIGCNVYLQGTTIGTTTDLDGNYLMANVSVGSYNLIASYISYNQQINRVSVEKNQSSVSDFNLEAVTVSINEVTVTARKRQNTEMSMISALKSQD